MKIASNLKEATSKIKNAQETLTPEMVKEMAEDIMEISEVAMETAEEIAENVPAEEIEEEERELIDDETRQIEVARDETEEEKRKRKEREAQNGVEEENEDEDKIKELEAKLASMERKTRLAELAPTYAHRFPKSMYEAKMNEIINPKDICRAPAKDK